jgi:hypothetical protein
MQYFLRHIVDIRPRTVLLVTLALLGAAIVWVIGRETKARRQPAEVPSAVVAKVPAAPHLIWPAITSNVQSKPPNNPFHSTHIEKYLARLAAEKAAAEETARKEAAEAARKAAEEAARKAAEEAARKAAEEAARKAQAVQPGQPAGPPPPVFAEYVYRGLLQRTDGGIMALIETRQPPVSRFYSVGEACRGMVVTNIAARQLDLIRPDGGVQTLKVGEAWKVEEKPGAK